MLRIKQFILKYTIIFSILCLLLSGLLVEKMIHVVGPGNRGVLYRPFRGGTDLEHIMQEGLHTLYPWNQMYSYDIRVKKIEASYDVLTKTGLSVNIDVVAIFRPQRKKLGFLHQEIGPHYVKKIIIPHVDSCVRTVVGRYRPEHIWDSKFRGINNEIMQLCSAYLKKKYVDLMHVLIPKIILPEKVNSSIEVKLVSDQERDQYRWKLKQEEEEVKRKEIVANGIRNYHQIIRGSLSNKLLAWKGIKATLKVMQSKNSNVVIRSNKHGLATIYDYEVDSKKSSKSSKEKMNEE